MIVLWLSPIQKNILITLQSDIYLLFHFFHRLFFFYTKNKGAASCQDCLAGRYGAACDKCPSGQFRSAESTDPTKCVSCDPGFYRNETGKATCLACTPGQYQPSSDSIECIKCKNGQYSVSTNEIKCTACPLGSGTFQDGSAFCEFFFFFITLWEFSRQQTFGSCSSALVVSV